MICMKVCMDCEKRFIGCHSTCKEYDAEKEKMEAVKERRRMEMQAIYFLGRPIKRWKMKV